MDENFNIEGNTEIQKSFKNVEATKIVQLVMKWFGFQEQKKAEYVLFGFVIVAVAISLFLVFPKNISMKNKTIPQFREDIEPSVRENLPPGVFETIPSKYD